MLDAAAERWDLPLELVDFPWSADHYLETGETLPDGALEDLTENFSAVFVGAFGDPRVPDMKHAADILLGMRFKLDLYINFRPIKLYDQRLCPLQGQNCRRHRLRRLQREHRGRLRGGGWQPQEGYT